MTVPIQDALFLVWGPPSHGPRSRVFARALGIPIEFVTSTTRRGILVAPFKYAVQTIATIRILRDRRPALVFVQSPPSFAPLVVALFGRCRFVIDAHSDAMQAIHWTRPRFLYRWLARRAITTIVTNRTFADRIERWGAHALVLRDVPTEFPQDGSYPLADGKNIAVVSTFASDEPTTEIVKAAARLPEVTFHITGDRRRAPSELVSNLPANVNLTGFLPDADYYALLRGAHAVMCLTTRDDTMQRGACEALSLGRPIITSRTTLLEDYFRLGTVHVENTEEAIRGGIERLFENQIGFEKEIELLQLEQWREWDQARSALHALIGSVG